MRSAALILIGALLSSGAASAREIVPAEKREEGYEARFPLCQDTRVLEKITERFASKEHRFWDTGLTILAYEKIQPIAWRPWGLDYIPRRFCTAVATISDGKKRRINYSVREDLDLTFLFKDFGVEWCVVGLDRNWAYQPHCRVARP